EVAEFTRLGGRGLAARLRLDGGEHRVAIGSARLMRESGVDLAPLAARAEALEAAGRTMIWVAEETRLLGLLAAGDEPRADAAAAVAALRGLGIAVVMLSGDNTRAARAVAGQIGIERVIDEVLTEDKAKEIALLRGD